MKDGKAWGETHTSGHSRSYGWMDAESAPIHDPRFCTKPTDVTYKGSYLIPELLTGEIVHVERITTVRLSPNDGTQRRRTLGYDCNQDANRRSLE